MARERPKFQPCGRRLLNSDETGLAITVNRLMLKPGVYEIDARMGCANSIGCFPTPHEALRRFAAFLNS
jgi:hypothetical protein